MFDRLKSWLGPGRATKELTFPHDLLLALGAETAAGVSVSPTTAMRCSIVYACVKIIAEAVAQLPLHLYERLPDGGKERAVDHTLYELLRFQPNDWMSAFEFRLCMETDVEIHGNGYAFVNRRDGVVRELVPIPHDNVTVEVDRVTMEPRYLISDGSGGQAAYGPESILHVRNLGTDHHVGLSPVRQAREAIGLSMAMEQHGARLFGKGARPGGVIEYAKPLEPATITRLVESFEAAHTGDRTGRTLVLEDGMKFSALEFKSVDLQFLELRRFQVAEISRVYRVPLHLLNDLERTTHANAESLGRQFLAFTLLPRLENWEGAIRRTLLTREERRTHFAEFKTDELARADLAARFEAYAKAITNGFMNPNEVRAAENRGPYDGGDQFRVPMNTEQPGAADG